MPIVNKKQYYFLNTNDIEKRTDTVIFKLVPFDDAHYWFVEFFDDKSLIRLKEVIPTDVLDSIKKGKIKLCLSNTHEAFNYVISSVYYHVIKELEIPEEQVLYISESANASVEITKQAQYLNKKEIKSICVRSFEYNIQQSLDKKIATLEDKTYIKKFLNLNRRGRLHRPLLISLLESFNIRDLGYISFGNSDSNTVDWKKLYNSILESTKDCEEVNSIVLSNKEKIENIPNMYLDTTDLVTNKVELDDTTDIYYQNSYFSIVSETYYYDDGKYGKFLSEKTFKAIAKCHPFILVSHSGTLHLLKSLGYKTFDPLIDESYDLEYDDNNRMLKIAKEVYRLSRLNEKELSIFLKKAKAICDYNYNHLKTQTKFFTKLEC
jgi:hypothetical protein